MAHYKCYFLLLLLFIANLYQYVLFSAPKDVTQAATAPQTKTTSKLF